MIISKNYFLKKNKKQTSKITENKNQEKGDSFFQQNTFGETRLTKSYQRMILCRPVKMKKFLAQRLINVSKNVGHFDWPTKKMFQFKSSKMSRNTNICKGGKYQYKQIFARLLFTIVLSPKPPNISTYERFGT